MTILAILLGVISFIVLVRSLASQTKFVLSKQQGRFLLNVHLVIVGLLFLTIILSFYKIYWRGQNSTTIILLLTTTSGLSLYWFHSGDTFSKATRIILLILSTIGAPLTGFIAWESFTRTVYYDDNSYRLELTFKGILAAATLPDLFVKQGIIERRYELKGDYIDKSEIEKIEIVAHSDRTVTIAFYHFADAAYGLKNPLIVDVKTD